ncbi:MAG: hypothetical protein HOM28_00795 [Rhodospirillales bacterium]|jgi:hypothetical protein|nr:hypothetical protein [Rhodospirillales bacterium]
MNKNVKNMPLKSIPSRGQVTTSKSRQRKRSEQRALEYLDTSVQLPPIARRDALKVIRNSHRPLHQAKQIILRFKEDDFRGVGAPDFSDVQELKVKLLRRDGAIFQPQLGMLNKLDVMIHRRCTRAEFKQYAGVICSMPQALPKEMLKAEAEFQRNF